MKGAGLAFGAAIAVLGSEAHAQSCQALVDEMRTRSAGEYTVVSMVSGQANKLASSSSATNTSGFPLGVRMRWNGVEMSSFAPNAGNAGLMQYNDRNNPGYVTGAAQNFSTHQGSSDLFEMWIPGNASMVGIRNLRWGNLIVIENPTCSDGLMFGFGNAVGNHNGGLPAMYVFSFSFMPEIG